jgi:hypothetical protein
MHITTTPQWSSRTNSNQDISALAKSFLVLSLLFERLAPNFRFEVVLVLLRNHSRGGLELAQRSNILGTAFDFN